MAGGQPTREWTCGVTRRRAVHPVTSIPMGRMNAPSWSTGSASARRRPRAVVDRRPSATSNRFDRAPRSNSSNRRDGRLGGFLRISGRPRRLISFRADCSTILPMSDFLRSCIGDPLVTVLGRRARNRVTRGENSVSPPGHEPRRATSTTRWAMFECDSWFGIPRNFVLALRAGDLFQDS